MAPATKRPPQKRSSPMCSPEPVIDRNTTGWRTTCQDSWRQRDRRSVRGASRQKHTWGLMLPGVRLTRRGKPLRPIVSRLPPLPHAFPRSFDNPPRSRQSPARYDDFLDNNRSWRRPLTAALGRPWRVTVHTSESIWRPWRRSNSRSRLSSSGVTKTLIVRTRFSQSSVVPIIARLVYSRAL